MEEEVCSGGLVWPVQTLSWGMGSHCLQNTFDKPSVWKNSASTSLSFFFFSLLSCFSLLVAEDRGEVGRASFWERVSVPVSFSGFSVLC